MQNENENAAFVQRLDALMEKIDRLDLRPIAPLSISAIVGDPNKRQDLAPYRALVAFKAGRFRAARARARRCVRHSGEWPLGVSFFRLAVTGECAIAALRFAGFLRACRIVELVDVVHHAGVLDGLSARFDSVTC